MTARQNNTVSSSTASGHDLPSSGQRSSATMLGMIGGLGVTIVFYIVAPFAAKPFAGGEEFVQRYFCGHPLEYITSAIFFVGMGILAAKFWRLPAERSALKAVSLLAHDQRWSHGKSNAATVTATLEAWQSNPENSRFLGTFIQQRLHAVLHYVTRRPNAGPEDHLKYLADLASDRLIQSYSLVRTVTWAVPIMGFLGTVVGITMAIANVTPEQLDSSLPEVTSGLAVAFDTTAQALGMSMILVFSTFVIERSEQSLLNETEQFGIDSLLPCLSHESVKTEETNPAIAEWTMQLLARQSEFWNQQFAALQNDWQQTLSRQTSTLAQALSEETQATLQQHRDTLGEARDQYATALQQSSQLLTTQLQASMNQFVQKVDAWQSAMQTTSLAAAGQAEELHKLGRTMLQLTESEQRLTHLQDQLNQNLQTLQIVETLEQTVNSLNAAVAVLTAKTSLRAVA